MAFPHIPQGPALGTDVLVRRCPFRLSIALFLHLPSKVPPHLHRPSDSVGTESSPLSGEVRVAIKYKVAGGGEEVFR